MNLCPFAISYPWFLLRILVRVCGGTDPGVSRQILIRGRTGIGQVAAAALVSSLSFFLITNFMVWATGNMYPHTITGLSVCFRGNSVLPESDFRRCFLHRCDIRWTCSHSTIESAHERSCLACALFPYWQAPLKSSAPWVRARCSLGGLMSATTRSGFGGFQPAASPHSIYRFRAAKSIARFGAESVRANRCITFMES
jgi:hypothetical protein